MQYVIDGIYYRIGVKLFTFYVLFKLTTFRRALDAEMRQANYEGIAKRCKRPEREGICVDEEMLFWKKGLLDVIMPKYCCILFISIMGNFSGLELKNTEISGTIIFELIRTL